MTESNPPTMDDQIQRLIDGELGDEPQWELLNRIDTESPARWRSVALGFVEAQVLRTSLREEESAETSTEKIVRLPASRTAFLSSRTMIAASITLLIGVALGTLFRPNIRSRELVDQVIAQSSPAAAPSAPSSFQAMKSIELALRDRGLQPVVTEAVFQADLPDGRRLLLPIQQLSVNP
jgi:hypothetical protein